MSSAYVKYQRCLSKTTGDGNVFMRPLASGRSARMPSSTNLV